MKLKITAWFGRSKAGKFPYDVRILVPEDLTKAQANAPEYHERALIKAMFDIRKLMNNPSLELDVISSKFNRLWFDHYDENGPSIAMFTITFKTTEEFIDSYYDACDEQGHNMLEEYNRQNPDQKVISFPRRKK